MKYLAYFLVLFLSSTSFATIDFTGGNFASSVSNHTSTDTVVTIWGGMAGASANSQSIVYDSCKDTNGSGGSLEDCNKRQVGQNVEVRLTFTSDADFSGTAFLRTSEGEDVISPVTYTRGQTVSLNFDWGELCDEMDKLNSDCTPVDATDSRSDTQDFTFGVEDSADSANTDTMTLKVYLIGTAAHPECNNDNPTPGAINVGIGDYSAFMGDEKVYFPGPQSDQAAPPITFCTADGEDTPTGGEITKVVAFYSLESLADVDSASSIKTMNLDGEYPSADLDPSFIESFDNDIPIFTRLAVQDQAGNILGITPTLAQEALDTNCAGITKSTTPQQLIFQCRYSTIPLAVAGLLAEDVNCFIATATFGSSMHKTVKDFRAFRSKVLLKSKWGTWLVKKYYKWGSYVSHFIVKSPTLKKISRVALQPFWLFAVVSLKIGFGLTVLLSLLLGAGLFLLTRKLFQFKKGAFS